MMATGFPSAVLILFLSVSINEVAFLNILQSYRRPVNIIALFNLLGFALLYFYQPSGDQMAASIGLMMIILVYLTNIVMLKSKFEDEILFLIVAMLTSIGMMILYRLDPNLGYQQMIWLLVGYLLFFGTAYLYQRFDDWDQLIYAYLGISLLFFMLTLVFGTTIKGATNWILIGRYGFQPSEIIKILFVLFMAAYFAHPEKLVISDRKFFRWRINLPGPYVWMGLVYLHMLFLVWQRELGTILLLFGIYMIVLYVFDGSRKNLLINGGMAILGAVGGGLLLHHVQVRIAAWLNPWADPAGQGYQISQSLFGIGAGGYFGTGIGNGHPEYIPEVNTDFIFSAICEEMGIFGGIAVVLLFFILVYRGIKITLTVRNRFHKAVALGLTVMFGLQAFIIIGGVIKLIPLTGITLPFISYGGSSLTTSFIALGILQAISAKAVSEEVVHVGTE